MSLMGRRSGGQYRSPLTTRDKSTLRFWAVVGLLAMLGYPAYKIGELIVGILWWVFG